MVFFSPFRSKSLRILECFLPIAISCGNQPYFHASFAQAARKSKLYIQPMVPGRQRRHGRQHTEQKSKQNRQDMTRPEQRNFVLGTHLNEQIGLVSYGRKWMQIIWFDSKHVFEQLLHYRFCEQYFWQTVIYIQTYVHNTCMHACYVHTCVFHTVFYRVCLLFFAAGIFTTSKKIQEQRLGSEKWGAIKVKVFARFRFRCNCFNRYNLRSWDHSLVPIYAVFFSNGSDSKCNKQ